MKQIFTPDNEEDFTRSEMRWSSRKVIGYRYGKVAENVFICNVSRIHQCLFNELSCNRNLHVVDLPAGASSSLCISRSGIVSESSSVSTAW